MESGVTMARMDKEPENIPAPPVPAIARPRMNMLELIAAPHRSEPRRKMPMKIKKVHLSEKLVYSFPARGCNEQRHRG